MVTPVPDFDRVNGTVEVTIGRPRNEVSESMVDVGSTLQAFQPAVSGGRRSMTQIEILPMDQIITRKGWDTYRDMLHDPQVKSTLWFKKVMIYGRKWDVEPASTDDRDKEIATFVADALKRTNFKRIMRETLSAIEYGYSVGEIIWEVGELDGQTAILLKDIKHRDPQFIRVKTDKHGNIKAWVQKDYTFAGFNASKSDIVLRPGKILHYAHDRQFSQHYGRSELRSAYRSWWAKKFIMKFWNVFLERLGAPMTAVKYPTGSSPELKETLKNILRGLSTKTEILIPEGVEIELIEATRAGTASYDEALGYHDKEIARALLMVALLGSGGNEVKRGSDSQSRIHLRTLHKMADETGNDIMWEFNAQVVKQLVDMNFTVDKYPRVFFQDYGEFESFEVTDAIRLLHSAGIVDLDQEDVNFARSILGMRIREEDEEDEVVRPPAPPPPGNANTPPPAAGQGNQRAEQGASANASPSQ